MKEPWSWWKRRKRRFWLRAEGSMSLEILTCEQNSEAWIRARLGIPTASRYATVLAGPQKGATFSKTRKEYLYKLAGERITGDPGENYTNDYMQRGHDME